MTYLSTIIADAPVHYWRLSDGLPSIAHDIGSSPQHLAINISATTGFSGIATGGGAIFCQPAIGNVASSLDVVAQAFPFTIELWFWALRKSAGSGGAQALFGWPAGGATSISMYMNTATTFGLATTGGFTQTSAAKTYQTWHHIVGVFAAANAQLYVDGTAVAAAAAHGLAGPWSQKLGIGCAGFDLSSNTSGAITEAAIYAAALTGAQVQNHFLAQEVTGPPVSHSPSTTDSSGVVTSSVTDLDAILNSVRKNY